MRSATAPIAPVDAASALAEPTPSEVKHQIRHLETELLALRESSARIQHLISGLPDSASRPDRISLVACSSEADRMRAAMVIATGAASTGTDVRLFFTHWAASFLRAGALQGKRPLAYRGRRWLPSVKRSLNLAHLPLGDLDSAVKQWHTPANKLCDLDQLLEMSREMGISIMVCQLSMELLGMTADDLLDYPGITVCNVNRFLPHALDSKITLFV